MLFANKKNVAMTVALAALLSAPVGFAREDGGGGPNQASIPMPRPPLARVADIRLESIEPAEGRIGLAAMPDLRETKPLPPVVPTGKRLGAFDSVAISARKLPFARKWRGVTGADYSVLFEDDCAGYAACDSALAKRLQDVRRRAATKSAREQLSFVNAAVNAALAYGADSAHWGRGDYWATPAETLKRGIGDCEDYATTKMWLLRSLGFAPETLQIVVLQDVRKRVYHAVLAVHLDGERLILDNLLQGVPRDTALQSYMPIMSFVADKSYIHGFDSRRSDLAELPKDLASVSPGEGV